LQLSAEDSLLKLDSLTAIKWIRCLPVINVCIHNTVMKHIQGGPKVRLPVP